MADCHCTYENDKARINIRLTALSDNYATLNQAVQDMQTTLSDIVALFKKIELDGTTLKITSYTAE